MKGYYKLAIALAATLLLSAAWYAASLSSGGAPEGEHPHSRKVPAVGDKSAYGSVLFEIDDKYPAMLSCVYLAVGHQRKVMYLPLPLGAAEEILKDDAFLRAAANTRRAAKQEFRFIADFAKTKAEAKKLLAGGDGAGAKKLLVDMVKNNLAALAGNTPKAGGESK